MGLVDATSCGGPPRFIEQVKIMLPRERRTSITSEMLYKSMESLIRESLASISIHRLNLTVRELFDGCSRPW